MSTLADYLSFARIHPELFVNPPDGGFTILLNEHEIRAAESHVARQLEASGKPTEWASVGIVYQDQYVMALRDAVRFPDGSLGTYIRFVNQYPDILGIAILPRYQEQILLIRHFRHATRSWHLEIPRGFGIGVFSEENARRELKEEIEATAARLLSLGLTYPDTGMSSSRVALFYAEIESFGQPEAAEAITNLLPTPLLDFERMIRENEITDGFALAAYARAKALGLL
ncbi:MAG TPA: NUDIX hydrolase [Ktedonobacteraceae bacterium]|nr:NUDIX hydrolase [Ktedonobacteraceae bacterium]